MCSKIATLLSCQTQKAAKWKRQGRHAKRYDVDGYFYINISFTRANYCETEASVTRWRLSLSDVEEGVRLVVRGSDWESLWLPRLLPSSHHPLRCARQLFDWRRVVLQVADLHHAGTKRDTLDPLAAVCDRGELGSCTLTGLLSQAPFFPTFLIGIKRKWTKIKAFFYFEIFFFILKQN